ncbi:MAG TPA: glycosyltransferase family 4 protein, partial [Bacteroidia bacterium]|nr:glycosyltransferase family 4 protein [Bacteroidia bacterium]
MSGKKRIAFLGGGVLVIPNTLVLLEQLGQYHDITVYSDFHITVAPNACYKVKTVPPPKLYRKFKNALFAWMVWKDLIGKRIDLIHAHSTFPNGFWGIVIGRLLRIPVIVSMDAGEAIGLPDIGFGDLLNPRRAFINKWVLRRATRILVPSQFHLQHVRDNLRISGPIRVIIRGVDTATFRFSERPIAQKIIFLNVAYLHPVKDQETLLKCFKLLSAEKDSELIHIGKDYADGYYQQLAREMGIANRVSFLGFIPNQDLPAYYAKADILLHTSRFEGQAVVINEAMACGLVVCGTEVGILSDLSGTCCITVPTQDAEGLADSVLALLENETELKRLRTNARQW